MFQPVLEAAREGWTLVFSWPNILYPILGTLLAMAFAAFPGISGVTLMAIAIPFTIDWEPLPIMLLFGSFVGGATYMGSVTAILFNVPGTAPNAATVLDGYPMAEQGRAKTALACSATASALGSSVGVVALVLMVPFMRRAVLLFGPPEFLMLAVWGLTTLVTIAKGSALKGLAAIGIGLTLSFVGYDMRTAETRFAFGSEYLRDGLSLVPVFLGLFAVNAAIELAASDRVSISGRRSADALSGSVGEGVRSVFENKGLFLRSSILGVVVGMIPGIGATVASFLAYGHAAQSADDASGFGKGDIRGVLAPEAANDAKDGGALVPLLAFGVPGGLGTALLMAVLTLHGLAPGRELLDSQLSLVFVLIWSMFLSNWLTSIIGLVGTNPMTRITIVRTDRLVPFILVLTAVGAYLYRGRFGDVIVAFAFGVFGYLLSSFGWPRIPIVIALVLGPMLERNLQLTMRLSELGRIDFWTRPIVVSFLLLTLLSLALRWRKHNREHGDP